MRSRLAISQMSTSLFTEYVVASSFPSEEYVRFSVNLSEGNLGPFSTIVGERISHNSTPIVPIANHRPSGEKRRFLPQESKVLINCSSATSQNLSPSLQLQIASKSHLVRKILNPH